MKLLAIIACCCIVGAARGQFTFDVNAGYNYTKPKFVGSNKPGDRLGGGSGWQLGAFLEQGFHHWFVYSGGNITQNSFSQSGNFLGGWFNTTYRPVYLNIPVGVGYKFAVTHNLAVKLFSGIYGQLGVGGRIKATRSNCEGLMACIEVPPPINDEYNIGYKGSTATLAKTNAGIQFGAGILAYKRMEFLFMYGAGFSNVIPHSYTYTMRLNSVGIVANYKL